MINSYLFYNKFKVPYQTLHLLLKYTINKRTTSKGPNGQGAIDQMTKKVFSIQNN